MSSRWKTHVTNISGQTESLPHPCLPQRLRHHRGRSLQKHPWGADMNNPHIVPPAPHPRNTRPLHKRKRVWVGGFVLMAIGRLSRSPRPPGPRPHRR